MGRVGVILRRLGRIRNRFGGVLGTSWAVLEASWGHRGAVLVGSWERLRRFWGVFGASWDVLEASCARVYKKIFGFLRHAILETVFH